MMKINKEGYRIIAISGVCCTAIWALIYYMLEVQESGWLLSMISLLLLLFWFFIVSFFREPRRVKIHDNHLVFSPCDGRVVVTELVRDDEYFGGEERMQISIFMSVTNVHANWFPVEGTVKKVVHHNGNFYKAWLPKASTENERSTVVIETPEGHEVLVRQVAGAVARRIVTYAREGEECNIDEHMGFIKFGSRVDVYLPIDKTEVLVHMGQKTVGNQTIVARLK